MRVELTPKILVGADLDRVHECFREGLAKGLSPARAAMATFDLVGALSMARDKDAQPFFRDAEDFKKCNYGIPVSKVIGLIGLVASVAYHHGLNTESEPVPSYRPQQQRGAGR